MRTELEIRERIAARLSSHERMRQLLAEKLLQGPDYDWRRYFPTLDVLDGEIRELRWVLGESD